jgi:hypothetical protein
MRWEALGAGMPGRGAIPATRGRYGVLETLHDFSCCFALDCILHGYDLLSMIPMLLP